MTEHWKKHGYVHCAWVFTCLVLVISWLLVIKPDSDQLQELLNFSAAVASLFLAIVAIFYSMVSTQDQASVLHSTGEAANKVDRAAGAVEKSSKEVQELIHELSVRIDAIPTEIKGIRSIISEGFDSFSVPQKQGAEEGFNLSGVKPNAAGIMSLHLLYRSMKHGAAIPGKRLRDINKYYAGFFFGFSSAIRLFKSCNMKLEVVGSDVIAHDFGSFETDMIKEFPKGLHNSSSQTLLEIYEMMEWEDLPDHLREDESEEVGSEGS